MQLCSCTLAAGFYTCTSHPLCCPSQGDRNSLLLHLPSEDQPGSITGDNLAHGEIFQKQVPPACPARRVLQKVDPIRTLPRCSKTLLMTPPPRTSLICSLIQGDPSRYYGCTYFHLKLDVNLYGNEGAGPAPSETNGKAPMGFSGGGTGPCQWHREAW